MKNATKLENINIYLVQNVYEFLEGDMGKNTYRNFGNTSSIELWAGKCVDLDLGANLFCRSQASELAVKQGFSKTLLVKTRHRFHFRILTGYGGLTVLLHKFPVAIDNDTTISFRTRIGDSLAATRIVWADLPRKHTLVVRFHAFLETRDADTIATFL